MRRLLVAVAVAVAVVTTGAVVAHAAFVASGSGSGAAKAVTLPTGSRPTVSVASFATDTSSSATGSQNTSVSWAAPAAPADASAVSRSNATASFTSGGTCVDVVTATVCSETGLPPGSWRYAVTPRRANWSGTASPPSVGPTDLVLADNSANQDGKPAKGDTISIAFSAALDLTKVCAGWTGSSVNVNLAFKDHASAPATAYDQVTVVARSTSCTGGAAIILGTVDLGTDAAVTGDVTFADASKPTTMTWTASSLTLHVKLGDPSSGSTSIKKVDCSSSDDVLSCPTATFVPAAGLTAGGVAVTGTVSKQGRPF